MAAPVAEFSADNLTPLVYDTIQLTDESTNAPTSWSWLKKGPSDDDYVEFSTEQNPTLYIDEHGNWSIKLIATNDDGSDDEDKVDYVTASGIEIKIDVIDKDDNATIASTVASRLTNGWDELDSFLDNTTIRFIWSQTF